VHHSIHLGNCFVPSGLAPSQVASAKRIQVGSSWVLYGHRVVHPHPHPIGPIHPVKSTKTLHLRSPPVTSQYLPRWPSRDALEAPRGSTIKVGAALFAGIAWNLQKMQKDVEKMKMWKKKACRRYFLTNEGTFFCTAYDIRSFAARKLAQNRDRTHG
jgi:hypothetical protein